MSLQNRILGSYGPALLREIQILAQIQEDIFMNEKTSIRFLTLMQKIEIERKTAVLVTMRGRE